MDFTLDNYRQLLLSLQNAQYESVLRLKGDGIKQVLIRHDVDLKPQNSLRIAQIESSMGIKSIYYFRAVPESWNNDIIVAIRDLGHEVGYHYESLTTCKGDIDQAYQDFCNNLTRLSTLIGRPISTICMHGSPKSPYDSKDIWKKYDYHTLGIDFEPYLDTDFSKTFYLTDTGRRWDGFKVSVRDKIPQYQDEWCSNGLLFHSTNDIINALEMPCSSTLSKYNQIMITTHPQRWMKFGIGWTKEFVMQNIKNIIKRMMIKQ